MTYAQQAETLNLAGTWKYALDPQDQGEPGCWYDSRMFKSQGTVNLPGTLTLNAVGDVQEWSDEMNRESVRSLRQRYSYYGAAWYEYETAVPAEWAGRQFIILLERVMFQSTLWVNGQHVSQQDSLSVPHEFEVTAYIRSGETNRFTIRVDNRDIQNLGTYPSAYTEETQSIWNGIVGRIELQALEPFFITDLQIFPGPGLQSVTVKGICHNTTGIEMHAAIDLAAGICHGKTQHAAPAIRKTMQLSAFSSEPFEWLYGMGDEPQVWDEFNPNIYEMKLEGRVNLGELQIETVTRQTFGLRSFQRNGRVLEINGRPLFLRGTLECCIFPLTGHPPMELADWLSLFETAKDYGLNHIRFHSWCPPENAFEAADQLGFYLQVEAPMWMDTWNSPVGAHPEHYTYLPLEARRILLKYGNHPSFCIYSNGNELNGDFDLLHSMVSDLKALDDRHLYTLTTNWDRPLDPADDLFCAQTVDEAGARGQYFLDEIANSTLTDFREAIARRPVPVVTHEVGQYTVYPNVEEIDLYHGALRPVNLEVIRADLDTRGLLGDIRKLVHGSGMLALQLYREEIEAALRTPELGGFQLLDLHDFPGQSTATVGILNAFWNSKGLIEPRQFRNFCNATVLLLRMPKRIYTTEDIFTAEINIAHFGASELSDACIKWIITDGDGIKLDHGYVEAEKIPLGSGIVLGQFTTEVLKQLRKSDRLSVTLELAGTEIRNEWPIWVYSRTEEQVDITPEITITSTLDDELLRKLADGERVLFLAKEGELEHSARGKFHPVFWSPVHFATENPCGIIVNPVHPALKHFPTREYAEYQWKDLLDHSVSLVLNLDVPFDPIVQVIPNFYHNRKLTNLTEYNVGMGKLLICGINIEDALEIRPAAAQLRKSLMDYMSTADFAPSMTLEINALRTLLKKKEPGSHSEGGHIPQSRELALGKKASSDSVRDTHHKANNGNDGIGHTMWLAEDELAGHWWQVDLGEEQALTGIRVKFHQEGNFLYVIQASINGIDWKVASNQTGQTSTDQTRVDRFNATGRYVRIIYNGLPKGLSAGHYSFEVYGGELAKN
ncbi:sugar-binding domain-containing protein [Paenibacillus sp. HW567]|uniref:sugar-binding domain-containing protein n=1 Tax=Paenibacillus sp. HW567 TaxID=1034769 RepID=UPI00036EE5FB|nr:sugar-binding domain-containing protein [Paenibacillus sp. HW567]